MNTEAVPADWNQRVDLAIRQLAQQDLVCDVDYIQLRRQNVEKMATRFQADMDEPHRIAILDAVISAHRQVAARCVEEVRHLRKPTQKDFENLYLNCISHYNAMDKLMFQRDGERLGPEAVTARAEAVWRAAIEAAQAVGLELMDFNERMRVLLDVEVEARTTQDDVAEAAEAPAPAAENNLLLTLSLMN